MKELLAQLNQVDTLVSCSHTGEALEFAGTGETEALCAVATVAAKPLRALGELLSAGELERWYFVTEAHAHYVSERPSGRLVARGEPVKTPETTSKALHKARR